MVSIIFRFIFLIIFSSITCYAEITLERYSISTYANTNYYDQTAGYLAEETQATLNYLSIVRVGFRQYSNPYISSSSTLTLDNRLSLMDDQDPLVRGDILFYPNPFSLKTGSKVVYDLTVNTNVTVQIYDMFGHKIYERYLIEGMDGTKMGVNQLIINKEVFGNYDVPAGIYFLFLFDDYQQLIGRSKFAIIP